MEKITSKKNGLVYTDDFKTVVGIDSGSTEFTGTVPNGVTSVGEEAFSCCDLTNISLPDSVTKAGANLFCNSTKLVSVKLSANLHELSPFMFCGCKSLKSVEMPDVVEDFTEGLFADCSSLEEIPFRGGITTLPEGVFDSCTSIKSLVIPDSVTKICTGAIANCTNLETIVLPAGLEELESDWLVNCPKLKHIRISEDNYKFRTDEDSHILYKLAGSDEIVEIELQNKSADSLPGFKDPDSESSIISFDESEDQTMDEPVFLNDAEKALAGGETPVPETTNEEQTAQAETAAETAEAPAVSGMDARLAEILGQNKMYDEGEFSIMDIPQASESEIASNVLNSTAAEEEKFTNEEPVQVTVHETAEQTPEDMEAKLKEIMGGQNDDNFSINDIPLASDDELNANKILEPAAVENPVGNTLEETMSDPFAPVEGEEASEMPEGDSVASDFAAEESASFEEPVVAEETESSEASDAGTEESFDIMGDDEGSEEESSPAPAQPEISEDKAFMQNLFFETQKVEQQNTDIAASEKRILFVFAENCIETDLGKKFSAKLQACCHRLAQIHKFTSIYYFHETRMDNEKFREQVKNFMSDKDVLIACEGEDMYSITDRTREMASWVGIPLDNESIKAERDLAKDCNVKPLKLIVSDILEE